MNPRSAKLFGALFVGTLALLVGFTAPSYAQLRRSPAAANGDAVAPDVYKVQYFDTGTCTPVMEMYDEEVGGTGDGLVRVVNPTSTPQLCAMEYVFDANEELQECCGCPVTNDGLRVESVASNLTSNPSNGQPIINGFIAIVSSLPNSPATGNANGQFPFCNPALALSLTPTLRASISHLEESGPAVDISVQGFDDAPLDQANLHSMVQTCAFIHLNQTGTGQCTCGRGDILPAVAKAGR